MFSNISNFQPNSGLLVKNEIDPIFDYLLNFFIIKKIKRSLKKVRASVSTSCKPQFFKNMSEERISKRNKISYLNITYPML